MSRIEPIKLHEVGLITDQHGKAWYIEIWPSYRGCLIFPLPDIGEDECESSTKPKRSSDKIQRDGLSNSD